MKHIDGSFDYLRFNLKYTLDRKEEYKNYLLSFNKRYYGYFLVRFATECQLLLDQFMEVAWQKTADLDKKTPNVYFPVCYNETDFIKRMNNRMNVEKIELDYPDLFLLIKNIQPFICGESWLHDQYQIASERHSRPHNVYSGRSNKSRSFTMHPVAKGKERTLSVSNGHTTIHVTARRWGIPDRPPPKVVLKSKDEAVNFIENSISGTNSLICDMIHCFEKRLPMTE